MLGVTTLVWGHPKAANPTDSEHYKFFNKKQILATIADVVFAAIVLTLVVLIVMQSNGMDVGLNALTLSSVNSIIFGGVVGGSVLLMLAMNLGIGLYRQWAYVKQLKEGINTHVNIRDVEDEDGGETLDQAEKEKLEATAEAQKKELDEKAAELEAEKRTIIALRSEIEELRRKPDGKGQEEVEQQQREEIKSLETKLNNAGEKVSKLKREKKEQETRLKELEEELRASQTELTLARHPVDTSGHFADLIENAKELAAQATQPEKGTKMRFRDSRKLQLAKFLKTETNNKSETPTAVPSSSSSDSDSSSSSSYSDSDSSSYSGEKKGGEIDFTPNPNEEDYDEEPTNFPDLPKRENGNGYTSTTITNSFKAEFIPTANGNSNNAQNEDSDDDWTVVGAHTPPPAFTPSTNGHTGNVFAEIAAKEIDAPEYGGEKPLEPRKESNGGPPPLAPPPPTISNGGEKEECTPMEEIIIRVHSLNDRRGQAPAIGSKDIGKMTNPQVGLANATTRATYKEVFEGIQTWCEEKKAGQTTKDFKKIEDLNNSLFGQEEFLNQPIDGMNSLMPHAGDDYERVGYASTVYDEVHAHDDNPHEQTKLLDACHTFVSEEILPLIKQVDQIAAEAVAKTKIQSGKLDVINRAEELDRALKTVTQPRVAGGNIDMKEFGKNLDLMYKVLHNEITSVEAKQIKMTLSGALLNEKDGGDEKKAKQELAKLRAIHTEIIGFKLDPTESQENKLEKISEVKSSMDPLLDFISRLPNFYARGSLWAKLTTLPLVVN